MSDNGAQSLTIGHGGFVYWQGARLAVRYEGGMLEFVVKRPRDQARLKCKRAKIPKDEFFKGLERAQAKSAPRAEKSEKPPRQRRGMRRNI